MRFRERAMTYGLHVYDPVGDYLPVDVIVQNNAGTLFRVQVRGTEGVKADSHRGRAARISLRCGSGKKKAYLNSSSFDIFAAHVADHDTWYLVPSSLIAGTRDSMKIYPQVTDSRGQWEKFRDRWSVFDAPFV